MKMNNKIRKVLLMGLIVLTSFTSITYLKTTQVHAASSLEIIQDMRDISLPLKPFIYIGERMDWDVSLNDNPVPGMDTSGFTWSSSNPSIVSVENPGILTGHSKGVATITVRYSDGAVATAIIRIKQPAESISLPDSASFYVGTPGKLNAIINPSDTDDKANGVIWSSSDNSIASVNPTTGIITAKQNGQVTITATFTNKDRFTAATSPVPATISASTLVTIKTHVSSVKLNKKSLVVKKGATGNFEAIILPSTA